MRPALAGIGLKDDFIDPLLDGTASVDFVEVHAENVMDCPPRLRRLLALRERLPLSVHGVGLSLGGARPPDAAHLEALATLLQRLQPRWFSEHLAWSGHDGRFCNDLLPLAWNAPTLRRVCAHIDQVQERTRRTLLLENPATYLECDASTMGEAEFIAELVRRTGCGLLLDVNNAHVSAVNHGREAWDFIQALPAAAIGEIHLAGHAEDRDAAGARLLIDHHGAPVDDAVWQLYARTVAHLGPVPTLIERDQHIPPLAELVAEAHRARALQSGAVSRLAGLCPRPLMAHAVATAARATPAGHAGHVRHASHPRHGPLQTGRPESPDGPGSPGNPHTPPAPRARPAEQPHG
ncbi:MAG: hypothetical protein RLY78_241 [Pseudomonadota bacterium]